MDKHTSMGSKLQNTLPDNTNIRSTPDTSVSLPPLDYNIVDDMKKTRVNMSLFKLAKVQSQWDILVRALWQTKTTDNATSTSKGANTPPRSQSIVLNTFWMEETNSGSPHSFLHSKFSITMFTTTWLILARQRMSCHSPLLHDGKKHSRESSNLTEHQYQPLVNFEMWSSDYLTIVKFTNAST